MIDKNSNTTRIMDKLITKEYINKLRGEVDRREVNISITESGLELLKEIDKVEAIDNPNYLNLSDAESGLLSALLDKMRECPSVTSEE
jgi:DNA-binding MarR family transcriptional regulator